LTKAARSQQAALKAAQVKQEIAERKEAFERSLLSHIDAYAAAKNYKKVLALISVHSLRFPDSGVKAEIALVKAWASSELGKMYAAQKRTQSAQAKRAAMKATFTGTLSHQGLPQVAEIPAEWKSAAVESI
jgi:hypothetical protein